MSAKILLKRALGALYGLRPQPPARRIILIYHSIGQSPLAVEETVFRRQIAWLASAAEIVPLNSLLRRPSNRPLQVAITFDDGYASLYTSALPLLNEMKANATAFLNTGWIGTKLRKSSNSALGHYPQEQFLVWQEVEKLIACGWDVGSHGVDHLDLTKEHDSIVRAQLRESRGHIEDNLSFSSSVFAYTWGRNTPHLQSLVKEAGYTHAVTALHGAVATDVAPMAVPRIDISREYTVEDFKAVVRGDWDYLRWVQSW